MSASLMELRKLRLNVRATVNLVATGERIGERQGEWWCANLVDRSIEWTPLFPYPPHGALDEQTLLYVVAHEASHLKWSGLYETTLIPPALAKQFHRFVNAIEDIRVDRLSEREFGSFRAAKVYTDKRIRASYPAMKPEGWNLVDQVAMNAIYSFDIGLAPFGSVEGIARATGLWPRLSRIANTASTQDVATALEPIFLSLVDPAAAGRQPDGGGGGEGDDGESGDGEGMPGSDTPSDRPVKSDGKKGTEPIAMGEELPGIAEDAQTQEAKNALNNALTETRRAKREAHAAKATLSGRQAPLSNAVGSTRYEDKRRDLTGPINALSNRMKAVLRHNSQDGYVGGLARGRLDTGKAWRSYAGNPRIFRQRQALGGLDYSFGIIVDTSGSMATSGEWQPTLEATVLVAEALERAGMQTFVIAWDTMVQHVKPIGSPIAAHRAALGDRLGPHKGGTYEAPALLRAIDEFKKVQGARMLISITDGETNHPEESVELIGELRSMGVETVGLRLGGEPNTYYERRLRVDRASELVDTLPRIIQSAVRRGR